MSTPAEIKDSIERLCKLDPSTSIAVNPQIAVMLDIPRACTIADVIKARDEAKPKPVKTKESKKIERMEKPNDSTQL